MNYSNQRILARCANRALDYKRTQNRYDGQRYYQRAGKSKTYSQCQRLEHLAFHRLQCKQRQKNDHDNEDCERYRPGYLSYCFESDDGSRLAGISFIVHVPGNVFGDYDGGVHNHPYGDYEPAQAHKVCRHTLPAH